MEPMVANLQSAVAALRELGARRVLLFGSYANDPEHARHEQAPWLAAAAAKYIADVFMGVENLWKRRCRCLGLGDG